MKRQLYEGINGVFLPLFVSLTGCRVLYRLNSRIKLASILYQHFSTKSQSKQDHSYSFQTDENKWTLW